MCCHTVPQGLLLWNVGLDTEGNKADGGGYCIEAMVPQLMLHKRSREIVREYFIPLTLIKFASIQTMPGCVNWP